MPAIRSTRLMPCLLVQIFAAGVALSPSAYAQCETQAQAKTTVAALKQEMADLYDAHAASRKAFDAKLDEKLSELGWSTVKRQTVLSSTTQSQPYASLDREKYQLAFDVAAAKIEAEQAEAASNPRASCLARQKVQRLTRKAIGIDAEQMHMLLEHLSSAAK